MLLFSRSDGQEVVVDDKELKVKNPLLVWPTNPILTYAEFIIIILIFIFNDVKLNNEYHPWFCRGSLSASMSSTSATALQHVMSTSNNVRYSFWCAVRGPFRVEAEFLFAAPEAFV